MADQIKATNGFSIKVTASQIFVKDPACSSSISFPYDWRETQKRLIQNEDVEIGPLYLSIVLVFEEKGILFIAEELSQPVMVSMALFLQELHNL